MCKVIRADKKGVQNARTSELVPGDIVEIAGMLGSWDIIFTT